MMHSFSNTATPLLFVLFWLLITAGGVVTIVIFLTITWRWMRAHEKVAQNLENLVDVLRDKDQHK